MSDRSTGVLARLEMLFDCSFPFDPHCTTDLVNEGTLILLWDSFTSNLSFQNSWRLLGSSACATDSWQSARSLSELLVRLPEICLDGLSKVWSTLPEIRDLPKGEWTIARRWLFFAAVLLPLCHAEDVTIMLRYDPG